MTYLSMRRIALIIDLENAHNSYQRRKPMSEKVHDPVCHMDIDPATAAGTSEYKGQTYYFCSPGCKASFDKNPEKYLSGNEEHTHHH
jgi:YHS domain-containing protein